jgi:hypothetical protein
LRDGKQKFSDAGIQAVLVGMGSSDESEEFRKLMNIDFPLICDPNQQVYSAYHLRKTSFLQMISASLLAKGLKAIAAGHKLEIPRQDAKQLAGVFKIDVKGQVIWSYYSSNPSDYPAVEAIVNAV